MSSPLWTGRCELHRVDDRLVGANGGWFSDSGPVGGYLFRFVRDGRTATCDVPPRRETHEAARARLAGNSNVYWLRDVDVGHAFELEVYAVTFSGPWGNETTPWAEWGFEAASDRTTSPNRSSKLLVTAAPAPPPREPDVAGAITHVDQALAFLRASVPYKRVRDYNPNAFPSTRLGKCESELEQALYALRPPR